MAIIFLIPMDILTSSAPWVCCTISMIREIWRVLRPGGRIILMLYHRHSYKYLVILPLKRLLLPHYWGKSQAEACNMNDGEECPLAKAYSRMEVLDLLGEFECHELMLNQL